MTNKENGFYTVEASILLPFLISVMILIVYMVIYIYDKTLLVQDVNSLCIVGREAEDNEETSFKQILESEFSIISKEHPYISIRNLNLSVTKRGSRATIGMDYEYVVPLFSAFNRKVTYSKEIICLSPIYVLHVVEDIERVRKKND